MNHVLPRHKSKGMQSSCTGAEATSTFSCRLRLWRGPVDVTELGVVERGRDLGAEAYVRKGSPMNGIPLPLGGKGNELHTTTANGIKYRAYAQQIAPTNSGLVHSRNIDCALPCCIGALNKQFVQHDCSGAGEKHCSCTLQ